MLRTALPVSVLNGLKSASRRAPHSPSLHLGRHHQVPERLFSHALQRQSQQHSGSDKNSGKSFAFGAHFLDCLDHVSQRSPGRGSQLTAAHILQMRNEADKIIQQLAHATDSPSRQTHLEFTAYMVGPYRIMKADMGVPVPEIRQLLEDALQRAMQSASQGVRHQLDSASDAYSFIVNVSKDKEQHFFEAPDFEFRRARDTADTYHLEIHKCWYMKTLRQLDATDIGPSFCAFDKTWFDPIDPRKHGVRFTRPSTIAEGSDRCRFNWDRVPVSPEKD